MWNEAKLDVIKSDEKGSLVSGPFGSNIGSRFFVDDGIPVIRGNNLTLGRKKFIDDGFVFITEEKARELRNCNAKAGDIIFTAAGTLGQVGLIPKSSRYENYIISNKQIRLRLNTDRCLPLFVYYYLSSPHMRSFIAGQNKGSSVPLLTLGIVRNLKIPIPPLNSQKKIAAILSAYDDLIENNRRRIALLEKMAEEVYREWFVRLRFPGHEQAKFEKGVPIGWCQAELGEVAEINSHNIKRGNEPEWIEYLDISAVSTNQMTTPNKVKFVEAPGRARRLVSHGDVIWSSVRPGNRAYCLVLNPPESLVASTGFAVISPKRDVPYSFVHRVVTTDNFVEEMVAVAKGAAYPATSFEDFEKAKMLLPDASLLKRFHEISEPLLLLADKLRKQIPVIMGLRDALLPRLISGKLPVESLDIRFPPSMEEPAHEA